MHTPGHKTLIVRTRTAVQLAISLMMTFIGPASYSQTAEIVKLDKLQVAIQDEKDRVQIINFWATWCAPCIKELPLFEKINLERKDVRVRLVSIDLDLDPNPEKVRTFVLRKKIKSEVFILDERNPNEWIDKVDKAWSGALPATLVINSKTGKRRFVEKELHEGDLEKLIDAVKM